MIVFTTSDAEKDISECYLNGANSYITKPVDVNKFFEVIRAIESFWITIVTLPGKG